MVRVFLIIFLSFHFSMMICGQAEEKYSQDQRPVDLVYPLLDAANSRWFYFSSACRPFGMVNLSPDTQVGGAWGSGYRYDTDTIKGFSHIHGWQIAGVSLMPVSFDRFNDQILDDFYSVFDHEKEIAEVGYHKVELDRFQITTELTSTKRVGFHRLHFKKKSQNGILFQIQGKLGPSQMMNGKHILQDSMTLLGEIENAPTRRRPKPFKVFYVVKFDQAVNEIIRNEGSDYCLVTLKEPVDQLKMKVAISYTSHENALYNLQEELAHWDFDRVVEESKSIWNEELNRIQIQSQDSIAVRRFYTDLWHSLQGRRTISDANGYYPDNTGSEFVVRRLPLDERGKPKFNHYNSDSFWGAQWTINTLWGLLYHDVYSEFVHSLMLYYKDGGLVPRGPSGGNYTYVMTGASSTPFIVSAFQKGIDIGNASTVYKALKKNHMPGGIMGKAGYEHQTDLGGGLEHYIENGYVPYPIPEGNFGYHQDGASLTLEYAYQDYTLAQMANRLNFIEDYHYFMKRSQNFVHVFDAETNWMRPKNIDGEWKSDFDPYQYEHGFNESNGAQSTWFVGHDLEGLAELMGGKEAAVQQLNEQFQQSQQRGFTSGDSHERGEDPERARIPINYGNQPSMQTAFIFTKLGRPDLTQKWVSEVIDSTFSGLSPYSGYKGDEDQGLMGSLAVLLKLGMFQLDGGTTNDPEYQLTAPHFKEIDLHLPNNKILQLRKVGEGELLDSITFEGDKLELHTINHSLLMQGGILSYHMKK